MVHACRLLNLSPTCSCGVKHLCLLRHAWQPMFYASSHGLKSSNKYWMKQLPTHSKAQPMKILLARGTPKVLMFDVQTQTIITMCTVC